MTLRDSCEHNKRELRKIPTLPTGIFAIPIEQGKYIVYTPTRQIAFVANAQMVEALVDLESGTFDKASDPDGSLLEFLQRLKLIDVRPEYRVSSLSGNSQLPVSLTLVVEASERNECSCCRPFADGSTMSMSLTTARRAIDVAIDEARKRDIPYLKVAYHGGEWTQTSREIITASLNYVKTKALEFDLSVCAAIWTGCRLASEQLDWIVKDLDEVIVCFDKVPTVHDDPGSLDLNETYKTLLQVLRGFEAANLPHAIRLTVTLDQVPRLASSVGHICANARSASLYIEPTFPLRTWEGRPSQQTIDFISTFREAQRIAAVHNSQINFSSARLYSGTTSCSAPENSLVIWPDGEVITADQRFSEKNAEYLYAHV